MDGNGRWAKARGFPRILGHREGARNVKRISTACSDRGIEILTLYTFSVENWLRPGREVSLLMRLLKIYVVRERAIFMKNNIRLKTIGDTSRLPDEVRKTLKETIELTANNTGMVLQLALSYGGRDEMLRLMQRMVEEVRMGELASEEISEEWVSKHLDTEGQVDPDLVIRTSGELRTSNFLIWQTAYSEFYFTETLWPDFDVRDLELAFEDFRSRERRFGTVENPTRTNSDQANFDQPNSENDVHSEAFKVLS